MFWNKKELPFQKTHKQKRLDKFRAEKLWWKVMNNKKHLENSKVIVVIKESIK